MHVESLYVFGAKLFIGTFSNGVFVLDGPEGQIHSLNDRIPHVPIRSFARTKDNLLLVGADGAGVFCMDVATGELLNHYMNNGDDDKSLSGNTVSDICVDESGVVWIGTSTNGISYLIRRCRMSIESGTNAIMIIP